MVKLNRSFIFLFESLQVSLMSAFKKKKKKKNYNNFEKLSTKKTPTLSHKALILNFLRHTIFCTISEKSLMSSHKTQIINENSHQRSTDPEEFLECALVSTHITQWHVFYPSSLSFVFCFISTD